MFKKVSCLLIAATVLATASAGSVIHPAKASALSGTDWRAGRIIDDGIFSDKNSMSATDIQNFLNQKVGTGGYDSVPGQCDTTGARNARPFANNMTRAQYAASIGRPTAFTCLSNYYEVPKTSPGPGIPANNYGNVAIPAGAKSAAQLIWDAAQTYNISPKVLLTTIQKESAGPLTTDDWPWQTQYTYAMGAHCPDSGPGGTANCDANYAGFSIQISESAALFRYYLDNMNQPWWPYKRVGNNAIQYNPNTACGAPNVYIETMATAALYTYTPYQPNATALSNIYGSQTDGCSSYGNRNFWRIFNDWFGDSIATCDYPRGTVPAATNLFGNGGTATVPGKWTTAAGQGFAYVYPNQYGAFEIAVMAPSSNGLVWQGVWFNQTNPNITLWNTIFVPAKNSDGLTDIYYIYSTNWSKQGFSVGLLRNNGHGLVDAGTQWTSTNLPLDSVTFIPGTWTAGGEGFAYVVRNNTGSFDVYTTIQSGNRLVDQGIKWHNTNGSIARTNTVFVPADADNDGITDIYYATSVNWSIPGFTMGLMHNNAGTDFSWAGTQWNPPLENLGKTTFLPGNWTGASNGQGFAYASSCGSRGFTMSVMTPGNGTLNSLGQWWQATTVQQSSTVLIPADQDGDGFTDLYYTSPIGNNGFDVAAQHNNNGTSFTWNGIHWSPRSTPLSRTMFLPSR